MSISHKHALQLDQRLSLATRMIAPCHTCADIGADHGLLSASLLEMGIAKHMLVADVSAKALRKAEVLLGERFLSEQATFCVADGLDALKTLPANISVDTICILGMGGQTVAGILERGETLLNGSTLLLGAQTELPLLRNVIASLGYRIRMEELAQEGKHLYVLMKCSPALPDEPQYDKEDLWLGPLLKASQSSLWKQWLLKRKSLLLHAITSMESASSQQNHHRLAQCLAEQKMIDHALLSFDENVCLEALQMHFPTVQMIADWANDLAPFESAESFDNVGLLIADPTALVKQVLFCVDVTSDVVQKAIDLKAQLIISHHPIIFSPLRCIDYTTPQGMLLQKVLSHQISILSVHTNWDKAPLGICDSLAQICALDNVKSIDPYIRMGTLPSPLSSSALQEHLTHALGYSPRVYGTSTQEIQTVAVSGGAYGEGAVCAHAAGAKAYVVGEIRHHELLEACGRGMVVYESGHFATERPGMITLCKLLQKHASNAHWDLSLEMFTLAPFAGALQT